MLFLLVIGLAVASSSYQVDLSGGEVQNENVSSTEASQNWIGISGDVQRFGQGLDEYKIGELSFDNSQTGEVRQTELKGLSGGGYYLVFTPSGEEVQPSQVEELESGDLEKNGIFSQETFPAFYPDYGNITDTPDQTFTEYSNLMIENQHYNLSKTQLSSGTPLYLGKQISNSSELPVFIAPIEGEVFNGNKYQSCNSGGECSFEFILPRNNRSDNLYSINFWSSGTPVESCREIDYNGSTYIRQNALGSANSCINITSSGVAVDFLHQSLSGDGRCGIRMQSGVNQTVRGGSFSGYSSAVCANGSSSASFTQSDADTETVIEANDSEIRVNDISSLADNLVNSRNASVEVSSFSIGDMEIEGKYTNLDVMPSEISQDVKDETNLTPLNISIQLQDGGGGEAVNPGFHYPSVNDTGVEPTDILHIKQVNGSYQVEEMEDITINLDQDRIIFKDGEVTDFSYFAVFGEKVDTEEIVEEEEVVEEVVEETVVEETTTAPPPPPQPDPTPILMDLNSTESSVNVTPGGVAEISFVAENYGEVDTGEFYVGGNLPEGWSTVSESVDSLSQGETAQIEVLLEVSNGVEVGSYSRVFQAFRNRTTLDLETLDVNVRPSTQDAGLEIVSAPTYIRSEVGEEKTVGVLVENTGAVDLSNLTLGFRNLERCGEFTSRSFGVEEADTATPRFEYTASGETRSCTGAVTVRDGDDIYSFHPVSIEVTERPSESSPIILPLILVIWTAVTVYEVVI